MSSRIHSGIPALIPALPDPAEALLPSQVPPRETSDAPRLSNRTAVQPTDPWTCRWQSAKAKEYTLQEKSQNTRRLCVALENKNSKKAIAILNRNPASLNRLDGIDSAIIANGIEAGLPTEKIRHLIASGANPGTCNTDGLSPLQVAALMDNAPVMKLLLDAGAEARPDNPLWCLVLQHVMRQGYSDTLDVMISLGITKAYRADNNNPPPTFIAVIRDSVDMLKALLDTGDDLEKNSNTQIDAIGEYLNKSLLKGGTGRDTALDMIRLLVQHGNQSASSHFIDRLWIISCMTGSVAMQQALLEAGCSPSRRDKSGINGLLAAVSANREDLALNLMKFAGMGSETLDRLIHERPPSGFSALGYASSQSNRQHLVKLMLSWGGKPDTAAANGMTLLMNACCYGALDTAKELVRRDPHSPIVGPEAARLSELTALAMAIDGGHADIVRCLLENTDKKWAGTILLDQMGPDKRYKLLWKIFNSPAATEVVAALLDYGVDLNFRDPDSGLTLMMLAIQKNNIELVSLLLRRGADLNVQDLNGDTALHHLVRVKNLRILELLLETDELVVQKRNRSNEYPHDLMTRLMWVDGKALLMKFIDQHKEKRQLRPQHSDSDGL